MISRKRWPHQSDEDTAPDGSSLDDLQDMVDSEIESPADDSNDGGGDGDGE